MDLQVGGTSKISVNNSGNTTAAGTLNIKEQQSTPDKPANEQGGLLYSKADGKNILISHELNETDLTSGGGGGSGAYHQFPIGSDNRIATFSGADTLNGESALTFNGTTCSISPAAITSSGEDDKVLNLTQTLNDFSAAGGSDTFRFIKANLTQTDVTGWDNIY